MKRKTLSLIAIMASMLITGCGNDKTSSGNKNSNGGNHNGSEVDTNAPEGYHSVLTTDAPEARGVPSDMGLEARKIYNSAFATNPNTFDYLANNKQKNSEYYANFVDNLLEHDQYGQIRGALAKGAYYKDDFTRLRFKLREGVKWVDSGGNEYAEVTAQDFATGLQHLLDAKGGAETLAYYISGAKDYADGLCDFGDVGFRIINESKYEFEYILEEPCPFFHTFFEYTSFLPLNRDFFESYGGGLGTEWDPGSCDFGKVTENYTILYCGPFILSSFEENTELSMRKNPAYWDIGNVQIDEVNYIYANGWTPDDTLNKFEEGLLTSMGVNQENINKVIGTEENPGKYKDHVYEQGVGTTTYYFNWNLNRQTYSVGDCKSSKAGDTTAQQNTRTAILNENFRKAVFSSIPKIQMNAFADDKKTAEVCVRNSYTYPEFVTTTAEVTNETTGVEHSTGNEYYKLLDAEMKRLNDVNEDSYAQYKSSWDKETGKETNSNDESTFGDKENSYYNTETAVALKQKAMQELGNTVTYPIEIDYLVLDNDIFNSQASLLKARIEETLGTDFIKINLQKTANQLNYENSHFMAAGGSKMNFDLSSGTGWGPDYGDPATFLNTLAWDGDSISNLGFDNGEKDQQVYYSQLGDYMELYEEAIAVTDPNQKNLRYAKLAAAEAELLSSAVIMPNTTDGGGYAISRIVPRTNQRAFYGTDDSRFKYMVIVDKVLTISQRDAIIADWKADLENI